MTQTREKWDSHILSRRDFWMVWMCHHILCFHFFWFRSNVRKWYLDESNFYHCFGIFFGNANPEVSWTQLCWSFFSTIPKYINNSILKDTLQLKILRTWIKISADSFIKILVNIIKRKTTKVPWKLSFAKKMRPRTTKNIASFSLKLTKFLNLTQCIYWHIG